MQVRHLHEPDKTGAPLSGVGEMGEQSMPYIILDVDYDRRTDYGRSLKWLAPELADESNLTMTEDDITDDDDRSFCGTCRKRIHENRDGEWVDKSDASKCGDDDEHSPTIMHRKWSGDISGDAYAKLASAWSIDPNDSEPNLGMLTEYGHLDGLRFHFDGMDWNMGGETPIAYVTLSVTDDGQEWCPWTDAGECATARERSVAGTSNDIPACPIHGAYPSDGQ